MKCFRKQICQSNNRIVTETQTNNGRIEFKGCDHSLSLGDISICFLFCLRHRFPGQTKPLLLVLRKHQLCSCAARRSFEGAGGQPGRGHLFYGQMAHMAPSPRGENPSDEPQLGSHCKSEKGRGAGGTCWRLNFDFQIKLYWGILSFFLNIVFYFHL